MSEKVYDFEIYGVARGTFCATTTGMKEFMGMVFNSEYEGFCCEVSEDEVQRSGTDNDSE